MIACFCGFFCRFLISELSQNTIIKSNFHYPLIHSLMHRKKFPTIIQWNIKFCLSKHKFTFLWFIKNNNNNMTKLSVLCFVMFLQFSVCKWKKSKKIRNENKDLNNYNGLSWREEDSFGMIVELQKRSHLLNYFSSKIHVAVVNYKLHIPFFIFHVLYSAWW